MMADNNESTLLTGVARQVHKYVVPVQDEPTRLYMPQPARIVHVGLQRRDEITLWVEVPRIDPIAEQRTFIVVGTGHYIPPDAIHRGTVIDRPFVWHLYEIPTDGEDGDSEA